MAVFSSIANSFKEGWNKRSEENRSDNYQIGKNIFYYSKEYSDILNSSYVSKLSQEHSSKGFTNFSYIKNIIENPFKISEEILDDATKNYKFKYNNTAYVTGPYGVVGEGDEKQVIGELFYDDVVPSMFNPLYGIQSVSITGITPNLNSETIHKEKGYTKDLTDCSIKNLVKLSNDGELGRCIYKYSDFMYCKDLGKISNNRMITLRKFATPVGDDIWNISADEHDGVNIPGDIGRLITWLNEDNSLESILQYNYKDSFTDSKEGKFYDVDSRAESEDRGFLGKFINLANPEYNAMVGEGKTGGFSMGMGRSFSSKYPGASTFISSGTEGFSGQRANGREDGRTFWDRYDENRVYEPKATMRDTRLYEGKLTFTQSFDLVFKYELRAYENINPKAALLDLLNNIHQVTYKKGHFWGGEVWWKGAPENKQLWRTTEGLIDRDFKKLGNTLTLLASGQLNLGDFFGNILSQVGQIINQGANTVGNAISDPSAFAGKLINFVNSHNLDKAFLGIIKNKLGRPSIYAVNSILTGDPTGFWHITIGNPLNPIISMGNMIIDDTTVQHYGPLGIDDFPTGIKVTIKLSHGRSRDMTEIGKMYTRGNSGIGIPLARNIWEDFVSTDMDAKQFTTMWASTVPSTNYTSEVKNEVKAANPPKNEDEAKKED